MYMYAIVNFGLAHLRGVMVRTLDSHASDPGSNLKGGKELILVFFKPFSQYILKSDL